MVGVFTEMALVLVLTFCIAYLFQKAGQPLLVSYIISGILASPILLNLVVSSDSYEVFAHIGISLLLFIVGLQLNFKIIKEVGTVALMTGVGQILFTTIIGFALVWMLGYGWIASLIIATAIAFSSTIIIIKLLSDIGGLDKLYGKISVGFLLVQDLAVIVILGVMAVFFPQDGAVNRGIASTLILGILGVVTLIMAVRILLPPLLHQIARSKELLFLYTIAWALGVSVFFDVIGLSSEIGALLAGMVLASSPYQHEIGARIRPLRDFFIVLFFIFLGFEMVPDLAQAGSMGLIEKTGVLWQEIAPVLFPALLLSVFVLVGNPLIVFVIVTRLRYSARVAFLSGLAVSQISEFSIIMVLVANQAGLMSKQEVTLVTLVGLITITCSTYLFIGGEKIFLRLRKYLTVFESHNLKTTYDKKEAHEIILFGFHRIGFNLLKHIQQKHKSFLIVDHNPDTVKHLTSEGLHAQFGDANNIEYLNGFDYKSAKLIISTIPGYDVNSLIIDQAKSQNEEISIICTAEHTQDALDLYEDGADFVILPHLIGGRYMSSMITDFHESPDSLLKQKLEHIDELLERKKKGHY